MDPLMKEGIWLLRFFSIVNHRMTWYFGGMYTTAQEAYLRGLKYVVDNVDIFEENGDGRLPENMAIELVGMGDYPQKVEEQFIFSYFPDQMGAYMDSHGVTRASYILKRRELLGKAGLMTVNASEPIEE